VSVDTLASRARSRTPQPSAARAFSDKGPARHRPTAIAAAGNSVHRG
jgi:hypothetical protein